MSLASKQLTLSKKSSMKQQSPEEANNTDTHKEFYKELAEAGRPSVWSTLVLIFMCMPSLCHVVLHTAFAKISNFDLKTRCLIPELEDTNWSFDQIRTVASPENSSCLYYLINYHLIRNMSYEDALKYVQSLEFKSRTRCYKFVFETSNNNTIYTEFTLVCHRTLYEIILNISPVYGKILGSLLLVPLADLLGRKRLINWGVWMFISGGLLIALTEHIAIVILGRIIFGMAYVSMVRPIEAIVVEISTPSLRPFRFAVINVGIPIGMYIISLIATKVHLWRLIQWCVSGFILLLPLAEWYIPESPRWYMSKKQKAKAWAVLHVLRDPVTQSELLLSYRNKKRSLIDEIHQHTDDIKPFFTCGIWYCTAMFACIGAVYFKNYVLRFPMNLPILRSDYFIVSGIVELIGYFICTLLLLIVKRRITIALSFAVAGFAYIGASQVKIGSIENLIVLLIIEVATSCVYVASLLYIAEIVPTSHRCTIVGISEGLGAGISSMVMFYVHTYFLKEELLFISLSVFCFGGAIASIFWFELKRENMKDIYDTVDEIIRVHVN